MHGLVVQAIPKSEMSRHHRSAAGLMLFVCAIAIWTCGATAETKWSYSLESEPSSGDIEVLAEFRMGLPWQGNFVDSLTLTVKNHSDSTITVVWDNSVIVLPSGESSRVIRSGTLNITKAMEQASSPIAPGSYTEVFIWPVELMTERGPGNLDIADGDTVSLRLAWDATGRRQEGAWTWRFWEVEEAEQAQKAEQVKAPGTPGSFPWWLWWLAPILAVWTIVAIVYAYQTGTIP
jgi:hypothetical protein